MNERRGADEPDIPTVSLDNSREPRARFQAALQSGQSPQIEAYLEEAPEPARPELFRELLVLELEYCCTRGESPTPAQYRQRFPDQGELIDGVFVERASSPRSSTEDWEERDTDRTLSVASPAAVAPDAQRLGRFELLEKLGQGGFGAVYRAKDPQLDREVALKIPRPGTLEDEQDLQRFLREARAAAQLRHAHIVPIHEAGEVEGIHYIASEFIRGTSLAERLKSGWKPAPREAAALTAELASALHFAHNKGIIHRDVKPANVMLDGSGEPLVMDFGLARREEPDVLRTQEGVRMGTPAYMSPEQARGESHLADARSDLWSLGVMLYELLAGYRPFGGRLDEIIRGILQEDPVPLRKSAPTISRDLATICSKCLQKDPEQRYPSAQHLADELGRWLRDEPIEARPISVAERGWRWARRHPLPMAVATLVIGVLLGVTVYRQTRPANLDLRVTPSDAVVTLDETPLALTNGQARVAWKPGSYKLAAKALGYVPVEQQVILMRGRANALMVNIELRSASGYIQLDSVPRGAAVEVQGAHGAVVTRGGTPFYSPRIPAGAYRVRVSQELYRTAERAVTVPDGDRVVALPVISLESHVAGVDALEQMLRIRDQLELPLAKPLKLQAAPLREALSQIADSQDVQIEIDERALKDQGIQADVAVSCALDGEKLNAALERVLSPLGLTYVPVREGAAWRLVVTPARMADRRQQLVVYLVGDLVTEPDSGRRDYDALIDIIVSQIAPATWDRVGGPASIEAITRSQALSVVQSWQAHCELYDFLTELRRTAQAANRGAVPRSARAAPRGNEAVPLGDATRMTDSLRQLVALKDLLSRPLAKPWKFEGQPLRGVLDVIAASQGVAFGMDELLLARFGVSPAARVSCSITEAPFGEALQQALESAGVNFCPQLKEGRWEFTVLPLQVNLGHVPVQVTYPVGDLMGASVGKFAACSQLVDAICREAAPNSWMGARRTVTQEVPGTKATVITRQATGFGTITPFEATRALLVMNDWKSQLEVYDYLTRLRTQAEAVAASAGQKPNEMPASVAPAPSPAQRRLAWDGLSEQVEQALAEDWQEEQLRALRGRLQEFRCRHPASPEAIAAAQAMSRLPWPADRLDREKIPHTELAIAADASAWAPTELVLVLGSGRLRHWGAIRSLAFSPRGPTLVSASDDHTIRIWDAESGELRRTLQGHAAGVVAVALIPGQAGLISVGQDHQVLRWNLETGQPTPACGAGAGPVCSIAVSPDGTVLATGGPDQAVKLWDVASGDLKGALYGHRRAVTCVDFQPQAGVLASAGDDGSIRLWDPRGQQLLHELPGHPGGVTSLAFSPDGKTLASTGNDGTAKLWNVESAELRTSLDGPPLQSGQMGQCSLAFCPDGKTLAWFHGRGSLGLWDTDTRTETRKIRQLYPVMLPSGILPPGRVPLAFRPDGGKLAVGDATGGIQLLEVVSNDPQKGAFSLTQLVSRVAFSPAGDTLALVRTGVGMALCDLPQGKVQMIVHDDVRDLEFSPTCGRRLAFAGVTDLQVWDEESDAVRRFPAASFTACSVSYSGSGQILAAAGFPAHATVWRARTGELLCRLRDTSVDQAGLNVQAADGGVRNGCVALRPDGESIAMGTYYGTVLLTQVPSDRFLEPLEGRGARIVEITFSPNGQRLAAAARDGTVRVWEVTTRKRLREMKTGAPVTSLTFRPDGQQLFSSHTDGTIRIWDPESGKAIEKLQLGPPGGVVFDLAVDPSGRHLATANGDGTVYVLRRPDAEAVPDDAQNGTAKTPAKKKKRRAK